MVEPASRTRNARESALSRPGICPTRGSNRARFAPLRPPGAAQAQPHAGVLPPLLPPRSRTAGANRGPEIPGDSSQVDPDDVLPALDLPVRVLAHAQVRHRG